MTCHLCARPACLGECEPIVKESKMTREKLAEMYLDWVNNYASLDVFAEHYGLCVDEAEMLIRLGRSCHENPHPDA